MSVMSANPELQKKLRNFIEECGSQTKAARALGKSAATLSTYLNDRYNGNLSDFEKFLCRPALMRSMELGLKIDDSIRFHYIRSCPPNGA